MKVTIAEGYTSDEEAPLSEAVTKTLTAVDTLTGGRATEMFDGLQIFSGEDVDGDWLGQVIADSK